MRITGEEIREQVAERYPEARPVSLEPQPLDRSGWWVFALLPLLAAVGSIVTRDYVQAAAFVVLATSWIGLPERVTFVVSTVACVGFSAWFVVDELADPSSSIVRAFHLGLGGALLLLPALAYRRRRRAS